MELTPEQIEAALVFMGEQLRSDGWHHSQTVYDWLHDELFHPGDFSSDTLFGLNLLQKLGLGNHVVPPVGK